MSIQSKQWVQEVCSAPFRHSGTKADRSSLSMASKVSLVSTLSQQLGKEKEVEGG